MKYHQIDTAVSFMQDNDILLQYTHFKDTTIIREYLRELLNDNNIKIYKCDNDCIATSYGDIMLRTIHDNNLFGLNIQSFLIERENEDFYSGYIFEPPAVRAEISTKKELIEEPEQTIKVLETKASFRRNNQ